MNSRERIRALIAKEPADRHGFWLGNPYPDTWPILHDYFGTTTEEELRVRLGDDFRWICPQYDDRTFQVAGGGDPFEIITHRTVSGGVMPFKDCEDPRAIEDFPWPSPDGLNLEPTLEGLRRAGPYYRASGFWCPFYHDLMDLFGMEAYLMKMYTHPDVVQAATDRVCQFYYDANERFFQLAGDLVDGFFFGNDFGTQQDLIISPRLFDRFIMPWFATFIDQGHRHGHQVILHSCGSIYRMLPTLIAAGVECLHPLQARAAHMDAETLAREFNGQVTFLGGIDTQVLLPYGGPEDVKADVRRVRDLLGPHVIISPSHEAILPDVPPRNIEAMAAAAHE
jgi:uroporphyrinogen decarboxylase